MKICEVSFRKRPGYCIETKDLKAVILPGNGGKMASLINKRTGIELLKQVDGDTPCKDLTYDGDYCEADVYGFDDMFPTIDPWDNGTRVYADHGEVIRLPWTAEPGEDGLYMYVKSAFGEYVFSKRFTETEKGGIAVDYSARNISGEDFPFLWAAHMMLAVQEGEEIRFEDRDKKNAEIVFSTGDFLGPRGTVIPFKGRRDLVVNGIPENTAFKYYGAEPVEELSYGCLNIRTENAPRMGVWMNNGDFQGFRNVAVEVCTGGFDTPGYAKEHGDDISLRPGEERKWKFSLDILP